MEKLFLGIDVGSTTLKAVLLTDSGKVRHTLYQRTKPTKVGKLACTGRCSECGACSLGSLRNAIDDFLDGAGVTLDKIACTVVTGSQITDETQRVLPFAFRISEVTAHVAGAAHYHPECKAILDVGGQDSKAMIYREDMQMWLSKMSGICAAGTGAFLDSVAQKLGISVEQMADMANYDSDLEFSSVCAVLSATSINKFKSRVPIGDIIGGACRAQARTIMSGVGEILIGYKGDILFQGGVAYNKAVAYYLEEITGNKIIVPKFHSVMGALGAACIARSHADISRRIVKKSVPFDRTKLKSLAMRASGTRKEYFSNSGKDPRPLVWRNLFFPPEILNALDVKMLTLETYAALFARNQKRIKKSFDNAAYKGFSAETCSFLRVLEGIDLPTPQFGVSTSEPCQQGERIFRDLAREYKFTDRFYSLNTPAVHDALAVEQIADGLEQAVTLMEKSLGLKMDAGRLAEACELSNEARRYSSMANELRLSSPPLIPGPLAIYYSVIFSQLWGKQELVDLQKQFYSELLERRSEVMGKMSIDDTHRTLWLHLPPFYDTTLLDFIEYTCNIPIVFEEVNYTEWPELDPKDPYRSLARKLLSVGFLDPGRRVDLIRDLCQKAKINGAFLYNHGFGRCSMADSTFIKHLREELNACKVPLIVLDGDCMDSSIDPCSTITKIQAFSESMNMARYGNILGRPGEPNKLDKTIDRLLGRIPNTDSAPYDLARKALTKVREVTDKVNAARKK